MERILIVDDEESIRRSLEGILCDEGFQTRLADGGDAALAVLAREEPDLVLLDIAMPGRDGLSVLAELRERWPHLPVVMMSGHGTIETAVRTTRLGAFDFIEKPLSIDKLLLTLGHALELSRLEAENRRLRAMALRAREILGRSEAILRLKQQIQVAGPTNAWVLITRRERHRQGAGRAPDPPGEQAPREPLRRGELRGAARGADRVGAVRPREGRLHRRARPEAREVRAGPRRDHLPRRDRGHEPDDAGQGAARAAGAELRARRRQPRRSRSTCA